MKLKGVDYFQQIGDQTYRNSTLDFLRRTQHYLEKLSNPTVQRYSEQGGKDRSRKTSGERGPGDEKSMDANWKSEGVREMKVTASIRSLQERASGDRPKVEKTSSYRFTTMVLNSPTPSDSHGYIVNKYSLPKALVPLPRDKCLPKQSALPPRLDSFLHRFDVSQIPAKPVPSRTGVSGWKLHKVRARGQGSPARGGSTVRMDRIGDEQDDEEQNNTRSLSPQEPYLEYVRWRKAGKGSRLATLRKAERG